MFKSLKSLFSKSSSKSEETIEDPKNNRQQRTSELGQEIIKEHEGLRLIGYLPTPNDVPTIGWGSTSIDGRKVVLGEEITIEQAQRQFENDLERFENSIVTLVHVPLTQNQFDALVSFVYNIGEGAFRSSTMRRMLNSGDYQSAADQFPRWNKQAGKVLSGLTKRRLQERELFLKQE